MKENGEGKGSDATRFISSAPGGAARQAYTKHIDQEGCGAGSMSLHNRTAEYGRSPYRQGIT
jgi:hypothetical protein